MARARRAGRWAMAAGAAIALAAGCAHAQSPTAPSDGKGKDPDVPVAYRPPPGMCRIWLANVPPSQQPAPTDCATAVRNRPANGRVLFGDDYVGKKSARAFRSAPVTLANTLTSVPGGGLSAWRVTPALNVIDRGTPTRSAQDEYEAGYAAGYRDAMNGRRPRFRGADRADLGTGTTGYATGGYGAGSATHGYGAYGGGYTSPGYNAPGYGAPGYVQPGGGAVLVIPPGQDPRYFNNGRYPPPGRANGVCLDRDGDGWCDDPRFGGPFCRDLDGDGRCDDYPGLAAAPYPSSLPDMRAGVDVQQGRGSAVALRWLGTSEVVARLVNPKRAGTPYRVLWFDANTNALVQTWTDLDGDGIADRVEIFRNGRRVKLLGR